jgi:hypothetical protein
MQQEQMILFLRLAKRCRSPFMPALPAPRNRENINNNAGVGRED